MDRAARQGCMQWASNPHQYPTEVAGHLASIRQALEGSAVCSILLLGSAARGELAYAELDGRLEVFSDYELLVVTERRLPARKRQRIAAQLAALERQFAQRNPLFHIDVLYRERRRLRTLPPLIFTFELKHNAQVLHGADVRPEIRPVTLENLDFRNTHEILYKRLWALLLHLPRRWVETGRLSSWEARVLGYVCCRNALDVTTVLLPHEGVLLPTYIQRVNYLASHYDELNLAQTVGPDLPEFLARCLAERRTLTFSRPPKELYRMTIGCLEKGLAYLLGQALECDLPEGIHRQSRRLFNEGPISWGERASLASHTMRLTWQRGPWAAWRWLHSRKKGRLTAALLLMHRALLANLAGQKERATAEMMAAESYLAPVALEPPPRDSEAPFPQRWLARRRWLGHFWWQYIRLGKPRYRDRFNFVMEWSCE